MFYLSFSCTRYNITVIEFVNDLDRSVVFFTNKTDGHSITEMPLKMALNTINHLHSFTFIYLFDRCY